MLSRDFESLLISETQDLAFIGSGDRLHIVSGVDSALKFRGSVPLLSPSKASFCPTSMFLTHKDYHSILFLDAKSKPGSVFKMDLETASFVEEFTAGDSIANIKSLSSAQHQQQILGVGSQSVFRLDPRQNGPNKWAEGRTYKSSPNFLSVAEARLQDRAVVVGSRDGQMRLFGDPTRVALTVLPGLGSSVVHLDLSPCGSFFLATTTGRFILFQSTSERKSFQKSLTGQMDAPLKLCLDPTDAATFNVPDSAMFTKASFSSDASRVVASIGPCILFWNVKDLLRGNVLKYRVKKFTEDIVSIQFAPRRNDTTLVCFPRSVGRQRIGIEGCETRNFSASASSFERHNRVTKHDT